MIVGSLVLIVLAVTLLVLGLADGSSGLLIGSIGASMLAAVALVVGARQAAAARAVEFPAEAGSDDDPRDDSAVERAMPRRYAAAGVRGGRTPDVREPAHRDPPTRRLSDPSVVLDEPTEPVPPGEAVAEPRYGVGVHPVTPPRGQGTPAADEPPDEPASRAVAPADAARIARMSTEVLVVDGRPRYHLAGCVHLLGREGETLPVGEAVELGFTPCSLCDPDSALLS